MVAVTALTRTRAEILCASNPFRLQSFEWDGKVRANTVIVSPIPSFGHPFNPGFFFPFLASAGKKTCLGII